MNPTHQLRSAILTAMLFACPIPASADAILTLLPTNGNVAGPAGSTVGWGYEITNTDRLNWFVSTALNADTFANGPPTLLFDFPIVAPGSSVTRSPDLLTGSGLYRLDWDIFAPAGLVNSGNFTLSGEWWDGYPLGGGSLVAPAMDTSAPYSAAVTGVPEPRTMVLLFTAASILWYLRLRNT